MKIVGIAFLSYVALVVVLESMLALVQPEFGDNIVITTTDSNGVASNRVLGRDFSGGHLYASANHWPRAWYNAALENPQVRVTMDGATADYLAIAIGEEEHARVSRDIGNGTGFKIMVGFAPQRFLRLDPIADSAEKE
ncbi:hypothetical protein MK489_23345 [Myxococcota bacterium]|nr:hypothetical protein [Myxococcota bacterium]